MRRSRRRQRVMFLAPGEQAVMFDLSASHGSVRFSRRRQLALVGRLVPRTACKLSSSRLCASVRFISELRVLAVQTPPPSEVAAHPEALDRIVSRPDVSRIRLGRVQRSVFGDVLVELGAKPPPDDAVTDFIYSLSGGHLALASQACRLIAKDGGEALRSISDSAEFVRVLLSDRLRMLGAQGQQAIETWRSQPSLALRSAALNLRVLPPTRSPTHHDC